MSFISMGGSGSKPNEIPSKNESREEIRTHESRMCTSSVHSVHNGESSNVSHATTNTGDVTPSQLLYAERRGQTMLQNLVHEEYCRAITEVYDLSGGKTLGSGCFGKVQIVQHRASGEKYALKTVELERVKDKKSFDAIMREVSIMKNLDHPNIVRLQEVYQTPSYLFIVMDLCTGGNLMQSYKFYSEEEAVEVVRSVVNAIRYCHDRNIAHRDLKLENIVREHAGPNAEVKLVDFGLSCHFNDAELEFDIVGTWIYMAPEVIGGSHFPTACDMWSIGVVAYLLLCGYPPFMGKTRDELVYEIRHGTYQFHYSAWQHITPVAKNFIKRLLVRNARERMTAAEAQHHAWINNNPSHREPRVLPRDVANNIVKFRNENLLKKLALKAVARALEPEHLKELEKQFCEVDTSQTGEISLKELKNILGKSIPGWESQLKGKDKIVQEENAIKAIIEGAAMDGNPYLSFNDFVAASMNRRALDEKSLKIAFDRLDYDHSGTISVSDLELMMGTNADGASLKAAIEEWDLDGSGVVDFREFCIAMRKSNDVSILDLATLRNKKISSHVKAAPEFGSGYLMGTGIDLSAISECKSLVPSESFVEIDDNSSDSSVHVIGDGYHSDGGYQVGRDAISSMSNALIRQASLRHSIGALKHK